MVDLQVKDAYEKGEWSSLNRVLLAISNMPENSSRNDIYREIEKLRPMGINGRRYNL